MIEGNKVFWMIISGFVVWFLCALWYNALFKNFSGAVAFSEDEYSDDYEINRVDLKNEYYKEYLLSKWDEELFFKQLREQQKKVKEQKQVLPASTSSTVKQEFWISKRRKDFVEKYWVWDFWILSNWEKASEWMWIDVDMWICIWFAESSMWRNLSSENNIWNVWNNDRWDRRNYETAIGWIRAIFFALNNKYLGSYYSINQLSRYWNKTWKIYASSQFNWHKNVKYCLSQIKWYSVSDNFVYRVWSFDPKQYAEYVDVYNSTTVDMSEFWIYGWENVSNWDFNALWVYGTENMLIEWPMDWKYWREDVNIVSWGWIWVYR